LDAVFEGVGMEEFIPKGIKSQEICISDLKKSDIVIFLISPYYGSLIETCVFKDDCTADKCAMKIGKGKISYTNCEYNITKADRKPHMTYYVSRGWEPVEYIKDLNPQEIKDYSNSVGKLKENKIFENMSDDLIKHYLTVSKEAWKFSEQLKNDEHIKFLPDFEDQDFITMVGKHLAENIVEWHTEDILNFKKFVDREEVLKEIIDNIDTKIEVWGVGGVGKTALVEVALLVEKLKGRKIVTIGTTKSYKSGSGFKDFRKKCVEDQYITESAKEITLYDVVKALEKVKLISNAEEVISSLQEKRKIRNFLSKYLNENENLIIFIDDFHLATGDVEDLVDSLESIILSSRKNSNIAEKEICITGIDEEDREDLINLFNPRIPEKAKEMVKTIAEGHPVATELLVKNYGKIDFDKIKDFELTDADDKQVKDFYKRVIEEIFSSSPQALTMLKDLAVVNTDLPTNINRESVLNTYDIENVRKVFNSLVDSGMLKKRSDKEGIFEFYFKHIQDALEDIGAKENHEKAIEYYMKKLEIVGENVDDAVEILYHKVKSNPIEELVNKMLEIKEKTQPVHYGFNRLIDVGEDLKSLVEEEYKAPILVMLGMLYDDLGRFEEAETASKDALEIYKELAAKNPDVYNPDVALTQNNLGILYAVLGRFEEAEHAYNKALEIYKELADKNPDAYNPDVALALNNLGILYADLGRFEEAETASKDALEIYKELAAKNPDVYNSYVASLQNNLGTLYKDLGRFEEAETSYKEALEMRKELAAKNPDAYNPYVANTQYNLGLLYTVLERYEAATHLYKEALKIQKKLVTQNPEAYLLTATKTRDALGILYRWTKKYDKAEKYLRDVLTVYEQLAQKYPKVYLSEVIRTLENLRKLYDDSKRSKEAKKIRKKKNELKKRQMI